MGILTRLKNFFKNRVKMTKKGKEISLVDYALAIISGAAIGYFLYKLLSGGEEHYDCPKCNEIFEGKLPKCPYCSLELIW